MSWLCIWSVCFRNVFTYDFQSLRTTPAKPSNCLDFRQESFRSHGSQITASFPQSGGLDCVRMVFANFRFAPMTRKAWFQSCHSLGPDVLLWRTAR
jgi:hypothetical protein